MISSLSRITDNTIEISNGEGIVLGIDEDLRTVRSPRRSIVVSTGHPGTGKTMSTVFSTIATSPTSSQVIHDRKGEILSGVIALGLRAGTRMVAIDADGTCVEADIRRIGFNPLHPRFMDRTQSPWDHAMSVVSCITGVADAGMESFKSLFGLVMMRMIGIDGRPAISRIAADLDKHFVNREGRGLDVLRPYASTSVATHAMKVLDSLSRKELDLTVTDMRTAVDRLQTSIPEATEYEDGAELAGVLADSETPWTVFMLQDPDASRPTAAFEVNAMAADALGRIRASQPHATRALQFIFDDAPRMGTSQWMRSVMRDGAPSGTSMLFVYQHLNQRRVALEPWPEYDAEPGHADHVLAFRQIVDEVEISLIGMILGHTAAIVQEPWRPGNHLMIDRTRVTMVETPFVLPPRRPRYT